MRIKDISPTFAKLEMNSTHGRKIWFLILMGKEMREIGFPNPYIHKPNMKGEKPMHLINQNTIFFPKFQMHEQYTWEGKPEKSNMHGGEMKKKMSRSTYQVKLLEFLAQWMDNEASRRKRRWMGAREKKRGRGKWRTKRIWFLRL